MREFSPQQAEDLYELISYSCRAGSLLLTSNRSPQDWYGLFANPVLAEGALDRLLGRAYQLVLQGRSYRPLQRPDRPPTSAAPRADGEQVSSPEVILPSSPDLLSAAGTRSGKRLAMLPPNHRCNSSRRSAAHPPPNRPWRAAAGSCPSPTHTRPRAGRNWPRADGAERGSPRSRRTASATPPAAVHARRGA
jgi:hypothetical protein